MASQTPDTSFLGIGIALGGSLGTALGIALDGLAIGLGCGVAFGVAFGLLMDSARRKKDGGRGGDPGQD